MEKFNVKYYEDTYLGLLKDYIKAEKENKEKALKAIEDFKAMAMLDPIQEMALNKLGYTEITQDNSAEVLKKMAEIQAKIEKDPDGEYFISKNKENYRMVVNAIPKIDKDKYSDDFAKSEIKRIKKVKAKRFVKKALIPVVTVATVIAIGLGVKSCSKNDNKSTDITTETTTETTIDPRESFTHPSTDPTTVAPSNNVIPSVSEDMKGIKINEPTQTTPTNGNSSNNGGSNNGESNNGGSNNGGSNNGGNNGGSSSSNQTEATTKPTETTTTPTTTTTTPETTTDPSVPTTEPVETKHTEPSDERNQRDVEVDIHDGKNPEYIEEDENQTYPTYIDTTKSTEGTTKPIEATTTTTTPTTKPTTSTVNGMPVEEDPDEQYPTFFDAGEKTKSKQKTLTLRK